jgi:hypothetical protein
MLSRDGGTESSGVLVTAWNSSNVTAFADPFYLAQIVTSTALNDDIAFLAILTEDLTGKMASINELLKTTICYGLPEFSPEP